MTNTQATEEEETSPGLNPPKPEIETAIAIALGTDGSMFFLYPKLDQKRNPSDDEIVGLMARASFIVQRNIILGNTEALLKQGVNQAIQTGAQAAVGMLAKQAKITPRILRPV